MTFWGRRTTALSIGLSITSCLGATACERGCVSSWLASKGATENGPAGGSASLPLNAVDCPDGLARCVDGVIEVSRVFAYASPCAGPPDQCRCPWDRLGACDRGCTAEDVEIVLARDKAAAQLCAPSAAPAARAFARAPLESGAGDRATLVPPRALCEGELYRCVGGSVVACATDGGEPSAIATCVRGCAEEASYLDDDRVTRDQAVALLCRR